MAVNLPYPNMDYVPLDILTAAEMNQMVANDQYLANMWGLTDTNGIILPRHLSSGVGAVIDLGSNANGSWMKFNNGTMICFCTKDFGTQTFTVDFWSQFNRSNNQSMIATWPQPFNAVPVVSVAHECDGTFLVQAGSNASPTASPTYLLIKPKSNTAPASARLHFTAIGTYD